MDKIKKLLSGRIGRLSYLLGIIFTMGIMSIADNYGIPVYVAMLIVTSIFGIWVMVRRLHDLDQTGWFIFLMLVPFLNVLLVLALIFWPGSKGKNKHGSKPKGGKNALNELFTF